LWNLFAVQEGGVLCGGRFLSWKKIQSYQFEPISPNQRLYGYNPEVNSGWELLIQTRLSAVSCIVTSEEVKEKLTRMLEEQNRSLCSTRF